MPKGAWILLAALALILPNLLWLSTSTLRIHNTTGVDIAAVAYSACARTRTIGDLAPGASSFVLLEDCGEDSLEIVIGDERFCRMYVEGDVYHVDAVIDAPRSVQCDYGDLLSNLLLVEALF